MNIKELELLTDDIQKTEKFYLEILEFKIISSSSDSISFKIGQSILTFKQSENIKPTYHFAFNIPNNKLDEAISWISPKVNLIQTPEETEIADFQNWNAKAIYFYDNNKNILELIARFDLKNISKDIFTSSSIQSISEAGIAIENPLSFSESLFNKYGIPYFSKGPKREDFVAMGDDDGLFVISRNNRNWYPTNKRAAMHYSKIKIGTDNRMMEIIVNENS